MVFGKSPEKAWYSHDQYMIPKSEKGPKDAGIQGKGKEREGLISSGGTGPEKPSTTGTAGGSKESGS